MAEKMADKKDATMAALLDRQMAVWWVKLMALMTAVMTAVMTALMTGPSMVG